MARQRPPVTSLLNSRRQRDIRASLGTGVDDSSFSDSIACESTVEELRLLRSVVEETIMELFIRLGIATTEPIEMQKDFMYLRSLREASQAMKKKTFLTITGVVVTTFLAFIIIQIKSYFNQ